MTWWNKFRWWLARKACPTMTIVVRCGKKANGRFSTAKQFIFRERPMTVVTLDCHFKFNKDYDVQFDVKAPLSKDEVQAVIDRISAPEGSEPSEMQEWRDHPDFDPDFIPREVPADILRDALKGTPLEGLDEKPGG